MRRRSGTSSPSSQHLKESPPATLRAQNHPDPPSNHTRKARKVPQHLDGTAAIVTPVEAQPPTGAIFHAKCGKWWTGTLTSHCSGCCETFSGLAAFDAHRTGSHAKGDRHCQPPENAGLTLDENRRYRCWKKPGDGIKRWNTDESQEDTE